MSKKVQYVDLNQVDCQGVEAYTFSRWNDDKGSSTKANKLSGHVNNLILGKRELTLQDLKSSALAESFGLQSILTLKQAHTADYASCNLSEFSNPELLATKLHSQNYDGLVVNLDTDESFNVAVAIKTADCQPVIIRSDRYVALLHIGWRGLEQKFASKVLDLFASSMAPDEVPIEILVGPAAGSESYEFGKNDLSLIGSHAVAREFNGKLCLNLVETLAEEVRSFENIQIFSSQVCTIENDQFYSHRREPNNKLRNLTAYIF